MSAPNGVIQTQITLPPTPDNPNPEPMELPQPASANTHPVFERHIDELCEIFGGLTSQSSVKRGAESVILREAFRRTLADLEREPGRYEELGIESLQDLLARPEEPMQQRIESLLLADHNTTIAAPAKTGKTSLMVNLVRSLVDGTPFLGSYHVGTPLTGRLAFWNYELSERQMLSWFRKAGLQNPDRVALLNLRGAGLFLQNDDACEWAIEWLRAVEAEVWVIDPLQAALIGTVNSDEVAADWISKVERVKAEAGVRDLIVVTHTGHLSKGDEYGRSDNERTVGSARWQGWPDNMWVYVKDAQDVRYLRAVGRDVDVEEFALDFDDSTITLTSKGEGTSRKKVRETASWRSLLELYHANPDATYELQFLKQKVKGNNGEVGAAIEEAVEANILLKSKGPKVPGKRGPAPDVYSLAAEGRWLLTRNLGT